MHEVRLTVQQPLTAVIIPVLQTFKIATFCLQTRCIRVSSLDKDLSCFFKPSSFLVFIWEIEGLCISIGQLCIHHLNFLLDWFPIWTNSSISTASFDFDRYTPCC